MAGTTDTSGTNPDALLDATIAEAIADVSQSDSLEGGSNQDEAQDATGTNPAELNAAPSSPATDGDTGPTAQSPVAAHDTPVDDDPLAGSEPVTITVDGETRTVEGFTRIPGQGIIIDEEKVPVFHLMASRAESLDRQNRDLYQRTQEYERLSEWKTKGPDGNERTLTGRDGLEAREVELARLRTWSSVMAEVFLKPDLFHSIAKLEQTPDGKIYAIPDPEKIQYLEARAELAARDAIDQTRQNFSSTYQATTHAQQQAQLSEQAPTLLWQTAEQVWGKEFPQLTAEDKTFLSSQVPRYMRPASPAEVQSGQFKSGESVLDPSFYAVMQDRGALRAQMTATATATTTANKFNQGQQQGRKPNGQRPPVPPPSASSAQPSTTPVKRGQEVWDDVLQNALREVSV